MPPATRTSRAKALAMAAVGILAAPACPRHSSLYQAEAQLGRGAIQRYSAQKNRAKVLLAVELRGAHRFEVVVVRRRYQGEGIPTLCATSGAAQRPDLRRKPRTRPDPG